MTTHFNIINFIQGITGVAMSITFPMLQTFGLLVQITGGLSGLVIAGFAIRNYILKNRLLEKELNDVK